MQKTVDRLGLSEEHVEFIRFNYGKEGYTAKSISKYLQPYYDCTISEVSIYFIARYLGVCIRHWSVEDTTKLYELSAKYSPKEIYRKKYFPNRSLEAICCQMKKLGINKKNGHDYYTIADLSQILGVEKKWLRKQIVLGKLKAALHDPEHIKGHGWWRIYPKNVVEFVRRYPGELEGRNVDMVCLVDLLVGLLPYQTCSAADKRLDKAVEQKLSM